MALEGHRYDAVRQTLMLISLGQQTKLKKLEDYVEVAAGLGQEPSQAILDKIEETRDLLVQYEEVDTLLREEGRRIDNDKERK